MPWRKILVASDLTAASQPALRAAFDLARSMGGGLLVLHVTEPADAHRASWSRMLGHERAILESIAAREREGAARVLEGQIAELGADLHDGSAAEVQILVGRAADVILDTARAWQAELIVMGTHGRQGVRRALVGSVAESVVREAPCPVLTVRA